MDLEVELEFQRAQLAQEEVALHKTEEQLEAIAQQVQFRRGCVAQVERLMAMAQQLQKEIVTLD